MYIFLRDKKIVEDRAWFSNGSHLALLLKFVVKLQHLHHILLLSMVVLNKSWCLPQNVVH